METHNIRELLGEHPFFAGLSADDLEFIAGCGTNVAFHAGEYVFREGEPADRFYVIRSGRVALEITSPDRGALTLDSIIEGGILGVSWLFPPYRWQFDARAVEPTRALGFDAVCLRAKCDAEPRLGYQLMQRIAGVLQERMQSARMRLLDLYGNVRAG